MSNRFKSLWKTASLVNSSSTELNDMELLTREITPDQNDNNSKLIVSETQDEIAQLLDTRLFTAQNQGIDKNFTDSSMNSSICKLVCIAFLFASESLLNFAKQTIMFG
jgi:hypothetical protein